MDDCRCLGSPTPAAMSYRVGCTGQDTASSGQISWGTSVLMPYIVRSWHKPVRVTTWGADSRSCAWTPLCRFGCVKQGTQCDHLEDLGRVIQEKKQVLEQWPSASRETASGSNSCLPHVGASILASLSLPYIFHICSYSRTDGVSAHRSLASISKQKNETSCDG